VCAGEHVQLVFLGFAQYEIIVWMAKPEASSLQSTTKGSSAFRDEEVTTSPTFNNQRSALTGTEPSSYQAFQ